MTSTELEAMLNAGRTLADGTVMSEDRLSAVFDLVKPEGNWKYPIAAIVPAGAATSEEVSIAVAWYAGGVPTIETIAGDQLRVTGAGYYEWVGA